VIVMALMPPSEHVHWWFATGVLLLGLCLLARAFVGPEVWDRRPWRRYLWPALLFLLGLLMFPVMVLFANSTVHMLAHGAWAQVMLLAGAVGLAVAAGRLKHPAWGLAMPFGLLVSGAAFLIHEQSGWLYSRSSFGHHLAGWILVVGAVFPLVLVRRPRSIPAAVGYALVFVVIAVVLFADRDVAEIFGHIDPQAGVPHR
jgi:hypothetical protein